MAENFTERNNFENNDGTVDQLFKAFEEAYKELKNSISEEFNDMEDELAHEKKQADKYRKKVQVRDVMDAILPILSDIRNDVLDNTDLNELKEIIQIRFEQLFNAFKNTGIMIQMHERNQTVDLDEEPGNITNIPITDPSLNQKVARSNKMGCVIEGEENNPILETYEMYVFKKKETPILPHDPDKNMKGAKDKTYSSYHKDDECSRRHEELKSECEERKNNAGQKGMKVGMNMYDQSKSVRLRKPVLLISESLGSFTIIPKEVPIEIDKEIEINVPNEFTDDKNCSIWFGSKLLLENVSLHIEGSMYYCIYRNHNSASFVFWNSEQNKRLQAFI